MSSRKRKHARRGSPDYKAGGEGSSSNASSSNSLFIQSHEATIIRDQGHIAQTLTMRDHGGGKGGLIRWQVDGLEGSREIWVDRYDARLLLNALPTTSSYGGAPTARSPSPTGWSELPSDSEDTFFFGPGEMEDFRREKRRKLNDAGRQERMRAMHDSDPDPSHDLEEDRKLWGGDDEEPDKAQKTLMERTAKHLLSSPNPGQLEMRILANHGSDKRFAFLRGRWRNAWQYVKLAAKLERDCREEKALAGDDFLAQGLVAYGDSDDEDGEGDGGKEESAIEFPIQNKGVGDKEKEARRARAREWAKKMKDAKADK